MNKKDRAMRLYNGILYLLLCGGIVGHLIFDQLPVLHAEEALGGVGILLDHDPQDPSRILVYSVTYKSPADKAKVKRGEQLLKIDGTEVHGMELQKIAEKIRGPLGSSVTLTLLTSNGSTREVSLLRARIPSGPIIALPPPNKSSTGVYFSAEEKALLKKKILGLTNDEQREKMWNLLQALKKKQISKAQFMKFLKTDF